MSFGMTFGQLTLEHTYNEGVITRVKLEYSGEKYYLFKSATNELLLYNSDHTAWKTIVIPAPLATNFASANLLHVSESKIDPDADIEVIFSYYDTNLLSYVTKIMSEEGTILATLDDTYSVVLSEIEGLSTKLIGLSYNPGRSKVYALPGLVLEHTYTEGLVSRIKLEISGEKYCVTDSNAGVERIYNSNHSLWKTIALPAPVGASYLSNVLISETSIDADDLLEIGYNYYTSDAGVTSFAGNIIKENNQVLLAVPNAISFYFSTWEGLAKKLMVTIRPSSSESHSDVYQLPGLLLEHSYPCVVFRTKLENSGEKYCTYQNLTTNAITVYNADHSVWKNIAIDLQHDFSNYNIYVNFITETKIASDPLLEIGYSYVYSNPLMFSEFHSRIVNENGLVYLDLPDAQSVFLSELLDLPTKLVALYYHSIDETTHTYTSDVFSVNPSMALPDFQNNLPSVVVRNPAKTNIFFASGSNFVQATLYGAFGEKIKEIAGSNLTMMDVEGLSSGFYLLQLVSSDNGKSAHKIIISQ